MSRRGLYNRLDQCSKVADKYWMEKLNSTLEEEFKEAWSIIPKNIQQEQIFNVCDLKHNGCDSPHGIERRSITAGLSALSGIVVFATFLYGIWKDYSASEAITELQDSHNEVIKTIESNYDKAKSMYKIGKHTLVKTEDLILKSYNSLYDDIC